MTIEELQQMPIVTVEQVLRFREAVIKEMKNREELYAIDAEYISHLEEIFHGMEAN